MFLCGFRYKALTMACSRNLGPHSLVMDEQCIHLTPLGKKISFGPCAVSCHLTSSSRLSIFRLLV